MADMVFLCSQSITRGLSALLRNATGIDAAVQRLLREGRELKSLREDVKRSVAAAERQLWVPREEVRRWLSRTDAVLEQLEEFEFRYWDWKDQFHGLLGFLLTCGCPILCSFGLGARAADLLIQVQDLKELARSIDLGEVSQPPPILPVEEIPESALRMVGREADLSKIQRHLYDDDLVGIIGICGMGGVGKTTLLVHINNSLIVGRDNNIDSCFDMVIFTCVSMEFSPEKLQRDIAKRCGLALPEDDRGGWARVLFRFLSKRRFLLILDDVWEAVDLPAVGIPRPHGRRMCKILLSTRSEDVCVTMDADVIIRISPLTKEASLELFRTKVRREVLELPTIREEAEALVASCGGLPLALITVGRAMANRTTEREWVMALRAIRESPMKLRGMDQVFAVLKLSFDRLSDLPRRCLIHCAVLLRDRDDGIDMEELIDSWIESGILRDDARLRGYGVIDELKKAALLETGGDGRENQVVMHDAVRDVALRLADQERADA